MQAGGNLPKGGQVRRLADGEVEFAVGKVRWMFTSTTAKPPPIKPARFSSSDSRQPTPTRTATLKARN